MYGAAAALVALVASVASLASFFCASVRPSVGFGSRQLSSRIFFSSSSSSFFLPAAKPSAGHGTDSVVLIVAVVVGVTICLAKISY